MLSSHTKSIHNIIFQFLSFNIQIQQIKKKTFSRKPKTTHVRLHLLDLGEVFEGSNRSLGIADIGIRVVKSHFDVLRKPFGSLGHFLPLLPHELRQVFVIRTHHSLLLLHREQLSEFWLIWRQRIRAFYRLIAIDEVIREIVRLGFSIPPHAS